MTKLMQGVTSFTVRKKLNTNEGYVLICEITIRGETRTVSFIEDNWGYESKDWIYTQIPSRYNNDNFLRLSRMYIREDSGVFALITHYEVHNAIATIHSWRNQDYAIEKAINGFCMPIWERYIISRLDKQ